MLNPVARARQLVLLIVILLSTLAIYLILNPTAHQLYRIATLNLAWPASSSSFTLSPQRDDLDPTFRRYPPDQLSSSSPHADLIPPILHHIALNRPDWNDTWGSAVQSCLDIHPGWESHIWTTESAEKLLDEKFSQLRPTWDKYPFDVQRVDALRYMVLYEYGGTVLDMDLTCRRALGPLRRFEFVAPAAHPTGFSVGFMMATKGSHFMQDILNNLPLYNKYWLGVPYAAVMFSTGCHFASVIHAGVAPSRRERLKILPGPLHSLSGKVTTPLFDHMGSSSWHGKDVKMLKRMGSLSWRVLLVMVLVGGVAWKLLRRRRSRGIKGLGFLARKG